VQTPFYSHFHDRVRFVRRKEAHQYGELLEFPGSLQVTYVSNLAHILEAYRLHQVPRLKHPCCRKSIDLIWQGPSSYSNNQVADFDRVHIQNVGFDEQTARTTIIRQTPQANDDDQSIRTRITMNARPQIVTIAIAMLSLIPSCAFGQTTRTSPSSASTTKSIPAASPTSPNSPCSNTNPSSPCYSANAPRNPCYSALTPDQPCSTTVTPNSPSSTLPTSPPPAASTAGRRSTERAITADQAKSQIEAQGYANVSGLQKDAKGVWRGKAVKDGVTVNVNLDGNGKITAN
jgi:hypothetical protein